MDKEKIEKNLNKTVENIKQYVDLKTELYSLIIIERTAKVLARVGVLMILTMLMFFFLLFMSFSFVEWFELISGSAAFGYIVVAFIYLILGVIIYKLKKKLFLDPLVKGIVNIFNEEEDQLDKNQKSTTDEED